MKKSLALFLAGLMAAGVFTACGSGGQSSAAGSTGGSVAVPSSSSEPEEPPYTPDPLTGLENVGQYQDGKRFVAVMINNISGNSANDARPQWGLSEAEVLVESKVEGGITRFMALYPDVENLPVQVGPVRSARHQFFQLALPWQALYVHIGESTVQTEYRTNYEYGDLDINLDRYGGKYAFQRDQARYATGVNIEHTAYTNSEHLMSIINDYGIDTNRTYNSTLFNFRNYNLEPRTLEGDSAVSIDVIHSQSYRTYFTYDEAAGKYMMSQYSARTGQISPSVDANNNEQLAFDNVILVLADIYTHPNYVGNGYDIQEVDYSSGGVGYYFCGGRVESIRWQKPSPQSVMTFTDGAGYEIPVEINPGKTYLGIVDLDMADQCIYREAESETPASVSIDPSEVDNDFVDS